MANPAFRGQAAELLRPGREVVHLGDDIGRHEADIVPLQRILRAGIPKADPELHARPLACAWRKKKPPASSEASGS